MPGEKDKHRNSEEKYREEINKESKPAKKSWWDIINSSFFLTVIIGLLTFTFTNWLEKREMNRERTSRKEKIDMEITSRLSFFNHQRPVIDEDIDQAVLILEKPSASDFPSGVFPEYRERGLRSLIIELRSLVPEEEQPELEKALEGANKLGGLYLKMDHYKEEIPITVTGLRLKKNSLMKPEKFVALGELNGICNNNLNLERWGKPLSLIIDHHR